MGRPGHRPRTGANGAAIRAARDMPLPSAEVWLLATVPGGDLGELSVTQEFGTAPRGSGAPGQDGDLRPDYNRQAPHDHQPRPRPAGRPA